MVLLLQKETQPNRQPQLQLLSLHLLILTLLMLSSGSQTLHNNKNKPTVAKKVRIWTIQFFSLFPQLPITPLYIPIIRLTIESLKILLLIPIKPRMITLLQKVQDRTSLLLINSVLLQVLTSTPTPKAAKTARKTKSMYPARRSASSPFTFITPKTSMSFSNSLINFSSPTSK